MSSPKYNKIKGAIPLEERLMRKRKVTKSGCWEFTGYIMSTGYGQIGLFDKLLLTHRASYMVFVGEIPEGMFVCHKCDNRKCFNPDHLFLGTADDNHKDMVKKGRQKILYGTESSNARLTTEQVEQIKQEYKPAAQKGRGYKSNTNELGAKFGITPQYVLQIIKGDWRKYG